MVINIPSNCPRKKKNCIDCYYKKLNKWGEWTGSDECFNAECIGLHPEDPWFKNHGIDAETWYAHKGLIYKETSGVMVSIKK